MSNRKKRLADTLHVEQPTDPIVPSHWNKGQLIDLKRFTDGSARAVLLGELIDEQKHNYIDFASLHDAQQFISVWYQRDAYGR